MYIDDFIWLPEILDKLAAKHHVTQDEVEEVFFNHPKYRFIESGLREGEDVYSATCHKHIEGSIIRGNRRLLGYP